MTVTLRSAVGPAGGKSAVGKSSSIPNKNPFTVSLYSNVAMVHGVVWCDCFVMLCHVLGLLLLFYAVLCAMCVVL